MAKHVSREESYFVSNLIFAFNELDFTLVVLNEALNLKKPIFNGCMFDKCEMSNSREPILKTYNYFFI